jgi:hypothetical protein
MKTYFITQEQLDIINKLKNDTKVMGQINTVNGGYSLKLQPTAGNPNAVNEYLLFLKDNGIELS